MSGNTVIVGPSEVELAKRTSDPSLVKGQIWFRDDLGEFRGAKEFPSFAAPSSAPGGVGIDSGGCIWSGDAHGIVYKQDRAGSVVSSFCFTLGCNGRCGVGLGRVRVDWMHYS